MHTTHVCRSFIVLFTYKECYWCKRSRVAARLRTHMRYASVFVDLCFLLDEGGRRDYAKMNECKVKCHHYQYLGRGGRDRSGSVIHAKLH